MKLRRLAAPFTIALAAMAMAGVTRASDDAAQIESAAIARVSAARVVSNRYGYYAQARAMALDGDGSVFGRTAAWLGNMDAYVEGWNTALAISDLRTEVPYAVFESELTRTLAAQTKKLAELSDEAAQIATLSDAALSLIANPESVPVFSELAQYQSTLNTLATREGELRTMLQEVGHTASSKVARLGDVDRASRKAIVGRLKAALIASGRYPLDQTLAQVNALLLAEKAVDPTIASLTNAFTKMNEYNANLALFHAKDAIDPARVNCTDARTTLSGLAPSAFVTDATARVTQLCDGIESLYSSLTSDTSIANAEYVGEFLRTETTKIKSACPATNPSPACEKLALFAALTPADLAKMDDARLRFVELGWSEAMNRALGK